MLYNVKLPILGFEDMNEIKLEKVDDMFATLRDTKNEHISMTLVNPYTLREYSFGIPLSIKTLLDINEKSNILVYNVVVIQTPIDNSCVNFLAPILFNNDNKTAAQLVLNNKEYPDFGMAQTIRSFKDEL